MTDASDTVEIEPAATAAAASEENSVVDSSAPVQQSRTNTDGSRKTNEPGGKAKDNIVSTIAQFLTALQKTFMEAHVSGTQMQYDNLVSKLSEHPYEKIMLPEPSSVENFMGPSSSPVGAAIRLLYTELYYRHMHQHQLNIPLAQRIASYQNYVALFKFFAESAKPTRVIMLPQLWAWDLVAEFIYQFCDYATFRSKLVASPQTEILDKDPEARAAWSVPGVLAALHLIADPAKCHELGYYAYVGLCRVHCAICDYTSVVALASKIDLQNRVYNTNPACQVTLFHRIGFAYMMLRRYNDAVKTFVRTLNQMPRMLRGDVRSQNVVTKKIDQICKLLMICRELAPQRIGDDIQQYLREHYAEKNVQLQNGNVAVFEEFFMYACPRFVPGCLPPPRSADATTDSAAPEQLQSVPRKQFQLFMRDASRQQSLSLMRSYLKLYTNMSLTKLAEYVEKDPEAVRRDVMYLNTNTHILRDGVWVSNTDVDIFIEDNMIHVSENKPARLFPQVFLRRLNSLSPI